MEQIRPLSSYKKQMGDFYNSIIELFDVGCKSKKHQENTFYWYYGVSNSGIEEDRHFFFDESGQTKNITTVTEMGRLLLTGWYYNIEDFTKEACRYVYNGYQKAKSQGKDINDLEFSKAVKHVRENIGFYYHNKNELKVYLLKKLFDEEVKKFLPEPPENVKKFNWIIESIKTEKENNLNKNLDHYYKMTSLLEGYVDYLQEILNDYGIKHISFEEYQEHDGQEMDKWLKEIADTQHHYDKQCKKVLLETKLLTQNLR